MQRPLQVLRSITTTEEQTTRNLKQMLECPVCLETMRPPILLCEKGHNICSPCKARLEECPLCRAPMSEGRNLFAEEVARTLVYRCCYSAQGCTVRDFLERVEVHEPSCRHRPYSCLLAGCLWSGLLGDHWTHVADKHPEWTRDQGDSPHKQVLLNCGVDRESVYLLRAHEHTFACDVLPDQNSRSFSVCVRFFGPAKQLKMFRWHAEFSDGPEKPTLLFSGYKVATIDQTFEKLNSTGFIYIRHFPLDFLEPFKVEYDEGALPSYPFRITISKVSGGFAFPFSRLNIRKFFRDRFRRTRLLFR